MPRMLDLRLDLVGLTPSIWRTLRVPADLTLADLHRAIQALMEWDDFHLHVFEVGDREYGPRPDEEDEDEPTSWAGEDSAIGIADALAKGDGRIEYVYDFGDEWRIEIRGTGDPMAANRPEIVCLEGERAAPPEDSGGPYAYQRMIDALLKGGQRALPEHTWLPKGFDATRFSIAAANEALAEEFRPKASPDFPAGPDARPEAQLLAHLTLLVLYLGSRETRDGRREAWKNVRLEVLDTLQEAGLIVTSPQRKSVSLTDVAVERAEALRQRLAPVVAEFTRPRSD